MEGRYKGRETNRKGGREKGAQREGGKKGDLRRLALEGERKGEKCTDD